MAAVRQPGCLPALKPQLGSRRRGLSRGWAGPSAAAHSAQCVLREFAPHSSAKPTLRRPLRSDRTGWRGSVSRVGSQRSDNKDAIVTAADSDTVLAEDEGPPAAAETEAEASSLIQQTLAFLLLISPFFFWGTSMVSMKELSLHTTPLAVSAWRLLPAGLMVLVWASSTGRKQPSGGMAWLAISLFGIVDGACFQGFLAEGLQRTSAGLGSVIIDSQPLSVAVMAALLFGESLTTLGVCGLVVGVAGLCLLEVPPEVVTSLLAGEGLPAASGEVVANSSIWDSGEWWMLLAAQSMAVGTVMVRWVSKYVDPVMATGWHMILGSIPLIAISAAQETDVLLPRLAQLDGLDAFNLFYVTVLGSAASYGVFFYNASKGNLTKLSSLTFLTPMFAAGTGYVLLGERLTPLQLIGATVTLGAVYLINTRGGGDAVVEE